MNIYFAGSIRGGRDDKELYNLLIDVLKKFGTVLTEHVGDKELTTSGEDLTDSLIFQRDISWIQEADVVIAEVTTPSLGVGYELGQAEAMKKATLCLYRHIEGKRISAMVSGNPYLETAVYSNIDNATQILTHFFNEIK